MSSRTVAAPTPILLLHGFAGSSESWGPEILDALARHGDERRAKGPNSRLVLAPDLPGHGVGDAPSDPERYRIHCVVKELTRELDERGIERADWVGYSMGGRVALAAAVLRPGRVRRVVIESASPGIRDEALRNVRRTEDEALAREIETRGIEWFVNWWEVRPIFAGEVSRDLGSARADDARARLRRVRLQNRPEALARALRGFGGGAQPSFWDRLAEVRSPTLVLTGTEDTKHSLIGAEMTAAIPDARHVSVAGAGHAVHREEPEAWVRIVKRFLDAPT